MKPLTKKLSFLLIITFLLQTLPITTFALETLTSHPTYYGLQGGGTLYQTINFTDIEGHWAKETIQEAAALSLMKGVGNQRFQPQRPLTYLETLAVLVKAIGKEEEAQRLGELQAPPRVRDIVPLSAADNWGKGYLQVALENNIVTPQEVNEIMNLTPQQMENLQQQIENRMTLYQNRDLTPQEITQLQNQIRDQLETRTIWNRPISRQQTAVWIARALELEGIYGSNMIKVYQFNDMLQIDTEKIPLIEAILQEGIMSGTSSTTFSPRQNLTRGQMAQMLVKIHDQLLQKRNLVKKQGEILNIEDLQHDSTTKRAFTIKNQDNTTNLVITQNFHRDFPVQKNQTLGLSNILSRGDEIYYYINQNNEVIYAAVVPDKTKVLEGFIENINPQNNQLVLIDLQNQRHIVTLLPTANIQINGKNTSLGELIYGMEVEVTLKNNKATRIQGYLEEDPQRHGYIPPGSRTKVGDILFIDSNNVEIRVDGIRERYRITPATRILRNDRNANLFEIKIGDRVILSFNDIYSPEIAAIRVEDHERHIQGIYQGRIQQVDPRNREIILTDFSIYEGGGWTRPSKDQIKIKIEDDLIYDSSQKITLRELTTRKDQQVYIAVENSFGILKGRKLLLKEGSSVAYQGSIQDINFNNMKMVLDNTSFNFNSATLVIKNNRLVDILNLDKNQRIYIAADLLRGTRRAAFVEIQDSGVLEERIDKSRLVVYRGTIEDIYHYGITLGRLGYRLDYLKLQDNQWVEISGRRRLTLTEDTLIFDSQLEKLVEVRHFIDSRFIHPEDIQDEEIRNRIIDRFYYGKQAYFVVRESYLEGETYEEVLAINITPAPIYEGGRLHIEHSSIGEIHEINIDQETITLNNVRTWNSLNKRWEGASRETITAHKAVILINDEAISKEELYRLRKRGKAYVVKSKNASTGDDAYLIIVEQ